MKKYLRYVLFAIGLLATGAVFYWQINKKKIVKDTIQNTVSKKSDSLYYIKYDSSTIDALNGNASFFNVVLQSDSVQQKIAEEDTSKNVMYEVRVGEIALKGVNVPGLLSGTTLQAGSIGIINPYVHVIRIGNKSDEPLTRNDSVALYEKLLGKFKSIRAGEIYIRGGNLSFYKKNDPPNTTLKNIEFTIKNFRIDSTKDYANLVSYFVKDVVAKVQEVSLINPGKGLLTFNEVMYDAAGGLISIADFHQKNGQGRIVSELHNIKINGLATNAFVDRQELIAQEISTDGGLMTLYIKKGASKKTEIELDSSFFDKAILKKISLGKTKFFIHDRGKPQQDPLIINNVKFNATDIPSITSGSSLKNIIANSKWVLSGDGLALETNDKIYKLLIGLFMIDNARSLATVQSLKLTPQMSELAFVKSRKIQQDLYDMQLNNILIKGIDIKRLLAERIFNAENISLQPIIKVFSDRTLPPDKQSKVGKYPHQAMKAIKDPFYIKEINILNGYFSYRERGAISGQIGQTFFDHINGNIVNATNIPGIIKSTPQMVFHATTRFMGVSNFNTTWVFPMNASDGSYTIDGKLDAIDGKVLNAPLEPQGMASVKKGKVNGFEFHSTGNDYKADMTSTLLYEGLKLEILKKKADENDLKTKKALSILANIIIRDENPHNGEVRKNEVKDFTRDTTRSFFNLVWKSMLSSIRKTIIGGNNAK